MLKITEPKILDEIVKHLFKDKRKTPEDIFIYVGYVCIYWKNNKYTRIDCLNNAELKRSPFDGHLYIKINIQPMYPKDLHKYHPTTIEFDVENDVAIGTPLGY